MSKRKLLIEVDCGKRRCKGCAHVGCGPEPYCEPFEADCQLDEKGRPIRLPACLAAEREVPADLSSMWGDVKCEPITYTFEGKVKP